jgi:hypothetical protein
MNIEVDPGFCRDDGFNEFHFEIGSIVITVLLSSACYVVNFIVQGELSALGTIGKIICLNSQRNDLSTIETIIAR